MTDDSATAPAGSRRRGSYAKGLAKREEILTRALEVIAREGYRGASVKEIADAVGLSQAGLLHYFDSKEELFTAILRKRDQVDEGSFGEHDAEVNLTRLRDGYVELVRHNSDVAGLVQLFSRMAVDATDPGHPGHEYFVSRGDQLRAMFGEVIRGAQARGQVTDRVDADTLARMVQAVSDGVQLQWMHDPSVDMAATVAALFELLRVAAPGDGAPGDAAGDLT